MHMADGLFKYASWTGVDPWMALKFQACEVVGELAHL